MSTTFYTSFVGRRALLAAIRERMAASRVVTLTGAGGAGKTRVAVRLAEEAARTYPEGCWVVGLTDATGSEQVGPAVAEAIGISVPASPWRAETLSDFIAQRKALLVLDNCEHLLPAVVDLVEDLRASCPGLHLLVTSRRPLQLSGEDVIDVPPLTLPAPGAPLSADTLPRYEAVALFIDRATSVRADFRLSETNAAAVADLCRELGGIPLAIELAAARVRMLTPQEILARLGQRLDVLRSGYSDVVDRHRSLRASVDWSFGLCSEPEQRLWERSSVFVGGFTIDAAGAVTSDEVIHDGEVMDLIAGLVDQAVLMTEEWAPGQTCYRMHDDIREFGLERVSRSGELDQIQARHAEWYTHLAAQFRDESAGADQGEWLQRLRREHPNIRAAIEHCLASPAMADTGLALATDVDLYWSASGSLSEGSRLLQRALDTGAGTPERRGAAMAIMARAALLQHDHSAASDLLRRAQTIAPTDDVLQGRVLSVSAMLSLREGRHPDAVAQADQAVGLLESAPHVADQLLALFVAGVCHESSGDDEAAIARHQRCISLAERSGERFMRAFALTGLGEQALNVGEVQRAQDLFREMIRIKLALGDRMGVAVGLESLGRVAIAEREGERAALLIGAAEGIWDLVGMARNGGLFTFAPPGPDGIGAARRRLGTQQFREAYRRGPQMSLEDAVRYALDETVEPAETDPRKAEPSPLTKREMEVAELVADGLSNPEIATRLVISVRTAQGHVENILRKLGFTSRSLVAAWMTERRLAERDQS